MSEPCIAVRYEKTNGVARVTIEVENALHEHPAVIECAIVGRTVQVRGARVQAFVRLQQHVSEADLKAFCALRVADYKVPGSFTFSADLLPRNAGGKILKRVLRERIV